MKYSLPETNVPCMLKVCKEVFGNDVNKVTARQFYDL